MNVEAAHVWHLSNEELAAMVARREQRARQDYAERLALLAEAENRGLAASLGYGNEVKWLGEVLNLNPAEARRRVAHATATASVTCASGARIEAPLPATRTALASGEISPEHVSEIRHVMEQVSGRVDRACYEDSEATMVELARQSNPAAVRKLGRRVLAYVDQDGRAPDEQAQAMPRRTFAYHYQRTGWMRFDGILDPESAAQLQGMFGALTKPEPSDESGQADIRTLPQRQGDALAEVIDLAARADEAATQGGERAAMTVTVSLDELRRGTRAAILDLPGRTTSEALCRLACQAKVIPAVLDTNGEALDVGRAARLATGRSAVRSYSGMAAALSPAATALRSGRPRTTSCTGSTAGLPTCTTWSCYAHAITDGSTTPSGESRSAAGGPSSTRPDGSTPTAAREPTARMTHPVSRKPPDADTRCALSAPGSAGDAPRGGG